MSRKTVLALLCSSSALLALAWLGTSDAVSQQVDSFVFVTNFPDVQAVEGTVEVRGLGSFGSLEGTGEVNVSPVKRNATTRLIEGGVVETEGFSHVTLTLFGEVRGEVTEAGVVGAILLPDSDEAEKVLKTKGIFVFPLEVSTPLEAGGETVFTAGPHRVVVAFPRYRVLFYNSTDKTVIATLSAYRTK